MVHKFHRGFTAAEKTELWDRWKRGESLKAIGRAFGKQSSSIYFLVAPHGGSPGLFNPGSSYIATLVEHERAHTWLRSRISISLLSHLRSKRSMRRSKPVDPNGDRRGHIKDIVSIRQRPAAAGTSKSFERSRACRSGLQDSIAPAFTAPIAFHFGAELVERHGAEHRDPLAEHPHPERHPQSALAALASDPRVTLGFELGDGAGVCHAALKRGTAGSATHMPAGSCGLEVYAGPRGANGRRGRVPLFGFSSKRKLPRHLLEARQLPLSA
jgi:hypothetical protein